MAVIVDTNAVVIACSTCIPPIFKCQTYQKGDSNDMSMESCDESFARLVLSAVRKVTSNPNCQNFCGRLRKLLSCAPSEASIHEGSTILAPAQNPGTYTVSQGTQTSSTSSVNSSGSDETASCSIEQQVSKTIKQPGTHHLPKAHVHKALFHHRDDSLCDIPEGHDELVATQNSAKSSENIEQPLHLQNPFDTLSTNGNLKSGTFDEKSQIFFTAEIASSTMISSPEGSSYTITPSEKAEKNCNGHHTYPESSTSLVARFRRWWSHSFSLGGSKNTTRDASMQRMFSAQVQSHSTQINSVAPTRICVIHDPNLECNGPSSMTETSSLGAITHDVQDEPLNLSVHGTSAVTLHMDNKEIDAIAKRFRKEVNVVLSGSEALLNVLRSGTKSKQTESVRQQSLENSCTFSTTGDASKWKTLISDTTEYPLLPRETSRVSRKRKRHCFRKAKHRSYSECISTTRSTLENSKESLENSVDTVRLS